MLLERDHYALINHVITALTSSVNFTRKYELSGSNNKFFILLNNFKMKTWSELLFCQYLWFSLYLLIKHSKKGNYLCGCQYHLLFMGPTPSWTFKVLSIYQVHLSIQPYNKSHLFPSLDVRCRNFQYTIVLLLITNVDV